eukprot:6252040-Amphidinium_carterae.1
MLLTRLVTYIIIEVPSEKLSPLDPKQPPVRNIVGREEKIAQSSWQLVIGKRACQGSGAVFFVGTGASRGRRGVVPLLGLTLKKGANRLQLVHGEAFWRTRTVFQELFGPGGTRQSVPEGILCNSTSAVFGQVGTCSAGSFLGGTHRQSGGTGRPSPLAEWTRRCQKKELFAPLFDDELWLTEASAGKEC